MAPRTFPAVWYLPSENRWRDLNVLAMRDRGSLTVHDDSLEFVGKKGTVRVNAVHRITYGKQGRDFVNNWVKLEYGDGQTAFFADGSYFGWGGLFGGTRALWRAVQHLAPAAVSQPSQP